MTASLTVGARVGDRLDVDLRVAAGETVAVVGPNGAGKSTLVALAAGLEAPDAGTVSIGGVTVADAATGAWVPPHRRGVALLSQRALLFPHLSALDNVAFGPRSRGVPRAAARAAARHWLDRVDAGELAARSPRTLSGGQAQRVALARALAASPSVLLLDEPMSALDANVVPALRAAMVEVLGDATCILVTHSAQDALALAGRIIVLERGRVVADGPTRAVLTAAPTPFVANLALGL